VTRTSQDTHLNSQKETAHVPNTKVSTAKNNNDNFDAIATLVQELRFNVEGNAKKRDIEAALQILFWPTNDNVWDRAESICMEKAKEIFSSILNGNEDQLAPAPNLKECLQVLVYLGEMRESGTR
jgi:hypothetical protein